MAGPSPGPVVEDPLLRSRFGLRVVPCWAVAVTPVFQGGDEKTGNVVLLNRLKMLVDGRPMDVPVVSGNSVRGYLRRLVMRDFLESVGYEIDLDSRAGIRLYHTLFAGGVLEAGEAGEQGVVDLAVKRLAYTMVPPLRLWGASIRNQSLEGKLKVSPMMPVARETLGFLPGEARRRLEGEPPSVYELLTRMFHTRRDEVRAPREEGEQAVQMIVEYEAFAPGTRFYLEFAIEDPAPIDEAVLARAIQLWMERPYIGGRTAQGLGRLRLECDTRGLTPAERYIEYLEEHRSEIVEALKKLEAYLAGRKP